MCIFHLTNTRHAVAPSFVNLLFQYRSIFHNIAARDGGPEHARSTVVCWVDVILVRLAEAVTVLVGDPRSPNPDKPLLATLERQMEGEALRAATQLPGALIYSWFIGTQAHRYTERWSDVVNVLSSENASPAALRLAVRLLFAVHVLRPRLAKLESREHTE